MSPTAGTNVEALARAVRLRPDIEWSPFDGESGSTWVARDPIALQYFHFSSLEKTIAERLNGRNTLNEVLAAHRRDGIGPSWLVNFAARLENSGLTVPREIGNVSGKLWSAHVRQSRGHWLQQIASPLAIRIKLFDPSWLLDLLAPIAKTLFHPFFVCIVCVYGIVIGFLVTLRLLETPSVLINAFRDLTFAHTLAMFLAFVCVKSLHELGHALACKKWNAECHEIGAMFLLFTPCLYCDTTDSWKLSSAWRRACIAAAGIYVELTIAAMAGSLWLLSIPGSDLHLLAANVMIVCSLSTFLVNANPLLRYDGYYVLSDLWRVPNLHEQSREAARVLIAASLTGNPVPNDRWDSNPGLLTLYAIAAWVYRHLVVVMIAWVVWRLFVSVGLPLAGIALVTFLLFSSFLAGLVGLWQWLMEVWRTGSMRFFRVLFATTTVLLVIGAFFYKPWPTFTSSRAVAALAHTTPVYAEHSGVLIHFVEPGIEVSAGSVVAEIESPELDLELIDASGSVAFLKQRTEQLKSRLVDDETAASELATAIEELAKERERERLLVQQSTSLAMRAPHAGIVIAGDNHVNQTITELTRVQAAKPVMTNQFRHSSVERGTLLGWIGKRDQYEIVAYVAEHKAELLSPGMAARCRWDCQLGELYRGTIKAISPEPVVEIPESLLGDDNIVVRIAENGRPVPEHPHYEVRIAMTALPHVLSHQSVGTVHFETAPRTCFESLKRIIDQQVRPEL